MKIIKKIHEIVRQDDRIMKTSQKHDANLQKNSTLYFQIGLIVCLLATYGVLEMKFLTSPIDISYRSPDDGQDDLYAMTDYKIYREPVQVEKKITTKRPEVKPILDKVFVDTKNLVAQSTPVVTPESAPEVKGIGSEEPKKVVPNSSYVNLNNVEHKPIFPGCERETTEDARMECFQSKITKFVGQKFNVDIASDYGLSGDQRIYVEFKVDKTGEVVDIKTRAPHPALEREAQRIIDKLPKMTPGMQRETPVSVVYGFPINFKVYN